MMILHGTYCFSGLPDVDLFLKKISSLFCLKRDNSNFHSKKTCSHPMCPPVWTRQSPDKEEGSLGSESVSYD